MVNANTRLKTVLQSLYKITEEVGKNISSESRTKPKPPNVIQLYKNACNDKLSVPTAYVRLLARRELRSWFRTNNRSKITVQCFPKRSITGRQIKSREVFPYHILTQVVMFSIIRGMFWPHFNKERVPIFSTKTVRERYE